MTFKVTQDLKMMDGLKKKKNRKKKKLEVSSSEGEAAERDAAEVRGANTVSRSGRREM